MVVKEYFPSQLWFDIGIVMNQKVAHVCNLFPLDFWMRLAEITKLAGKF